MGGLGGRGVQGKLDAPDWRCGLFFGYPKCLSTTALSFRLTGVDHHDGRKLGHLAPLHRQQALKSPAEAGRRVGRLPQTGKQSLHSAHCEARPSRPQLPPTNHACLPRCPCTPPARPPPPRSPVQAVADLQGQPARWVQQLELARQTFANQLVQQSIVAAGGAGQGSGCSGAARDRSSCCMARTPHPQAALHAHPHTPQPSPPTPIPTCRLRTGWRGR